MLNEDFKRKTYEYVYIHSQRLNLSEKTIRNKRDIFKRLQSFLDNKPFTLDNTFAYIDSLRERGVSANSIKTEIVNLKAFSHWLVEYEYTKEDILRKLKRPTVHTIAEPLISAVKAEEVIITGTEPGIHDHKLHRERKIIMRYALRFALRTGLRISELQRLRCDDMYAESIYPEYLVVGKGGRKDRLPLPEDMLDMVRERVKTGNTLLFPQLSAKTCIISLKRGAKVVGIPSNVEMDNHILRKIFGCTIAQYTPMPKVAMLMRHRDIGTTMRFYLQHGLNELYDELNSNHTLIRLSRPPEVVLEHFIHKELQRYFNNDRRFNLSYEKTDEGITLRIKIAASI